MKLIILPLFLTSYSFASVSAIYYAPTAAGGNDGTSCANAYAYNDGTNGFNVVGKWGAGSTQIGQDTVIHICGGTYSGALNGNLLTFQASGASGHPIILQVDAAATFTSPAWSGSTGAINTNSQTWLTLSLSNLTITNSANGDGLANQQISVGINAYACHNCIIEGAIISNIYVAIQNYSSPLGGTAAQMNAITYSGQNGILRNNSIDDCGWCLYANYANGDTNLQIYGNDISNWGHAAMFATGGANSCSAPCLLFHDNNIHDNVNWEAAGCPYHNDGLHTFGTTGSTMSGIYFYNNWFHGVLSGACSSGFLFMEQGSGAGSTPSHASDVYIWNNVFDASQANGVNPNGWMGAFSAESGVLQIYNNTIKGPSPTDATVCYNVAAQGANITFENNVSLDCSQAQNINKGSGTLTADGNMYGNACQANNNCFVWAGATFEGSLAAWKTACSCDAHSVSTASDAANKFTGFFPDSDSLAVGLGTNLTSASTGYLVTLSTDTSAGGSRAGVMRPNVAAWDAGAYQYVPPPQGVTRGGPISTSGPIRMN